MPRTFTEEKTVFKFAELSDSAKDTARQWYRNASSSDEFWDYIYEDAARVADILGIDLRQKPVKLMSGATRFDPCIYFDLDRADFCIFECTYRWKSGSMAAINAYAPQDMELHSIAAALYREQRTACFTMTATTSTRRDSMSIDVDEDKGHCDHDAVAELLRDFAHWIKTRLRAEEDWRNSDECIDDNITANEYEFTEDGDLA